MTENRVKHLEWVQSNIARMNHNSFYMKGWAITILSALLAIYAASIEDGKGNVYFLGVAIIPVFVFWMLDSYYLQQERKFRGIYRDLTNASQNKSNTEIEDFEMPLDRYSGGSYSFGAVVWSRTEWPIYFVIVVCLLIAVHVLK